MCSSDLAIKIIAAATAMAVKYLYMVELAFPEIPAAIITQLGSMPSD